MDFEVHCMSILPTELSLFNCEKVHSVLQYMTPLNKLPMLWYIHANYYVAFICLLFPTLLMLC